MKKEINKILLIFPSFIYKKIQSRKTCVLPVGLGCLASFLGDDYEVKILDSSMEGFDNEVELGNGLYLYGLSDDNYREIIAQYKPDLVGVSCPFSSLHNQMLRVARLAKEVDPTVVTVVGGPHPSSLPELILKDPAVDYCVIGEGELPFRGLLDRLREGKDLEDLSGIGYKVNGNVHVNCHLNLIEDIDSLPFPDWDKLQVDRYIKIGSVQGLRMDGKQKEPLRIAQVTTSRGCPQSCTYCGKYAVWGNRIRFMSTERVLEMLDQLVTQYRIERVAFQDDNLTFNRKRALALFQGMAERDWSLTWEAHNGLAFSTLDKEMIDAMAKSGCVSFTGAIESGSPEMLKKIKKKVDLERAIEITDYAKSIGLDVRAFYIIGFPGETREQIEATRDHMRRLQASVSAMAMYTPLPGSPLYKELEDKGIIRSETLNFENLSFGAFDLQLSEVSIPELHRIRKIDWLKNVFADKDGNLKPNLAMVPETIMKEIKNGLDLYPDSPELKRLHEQVVKKYGNL